MIKTRMFNSSTLPVIELLDARCLPTNEKVKNKRIREKPEKANKHIKNDTNRRQRALISSPPPVKRIYEAMLKQKCTILPINVFIGDVLST